MAPGCQGRRKSFCGSVSSATLLEVILGVLVQTGLSPHRLELEITKSMLLQQKDENLLLFRQLKNIGISIALDDFGVGYASLASFVSFPFDKVKVDRSFTRDLLKSSANRAVVASIMTLAHGLGVEVTAEGVETPEQLEYLRNEVSTSYKATCLASPARRKTWTSRNRRAITAARAYLAARLELVRATASCLASFLTRARRSRMTRMIEASPAAGSSGAFRKSSASIFLPFLPFLPNEELTFSVSFNILYRIV